MPPDADTAQDVSARALTLWVELSRLYDEIEGALHDEMRSDDLGALGRAIVEAEMELRPLVAQIGEIRTRLPRPSAAVQETWAESDRLIADLAHRQPTLTRAAMAARESASKALVKVRSVRLGTNAYRDGPKATPQFASRQA